MDDLEKLRYPVGRLDVVRPPANTQERAAMIQALADAPAVFRSLASGLTDAQLDTPYRPGGWTIRQVIHHVPDSHMNAYVRMKLAVTEDAPAVKTYHENLWAELPEAKSGPIDMSLDLLTALHSRWVAFLRGLPEPDFEKAFTHPEWGVVSLNRSMAMYEWHCRHHAAHIRQGLRPAV
jgi:hypothetical protein